MQQRWVAASQIALEEGSSDVSKNMQSTNLRLSYVYESLPQYNYFDQEVNPAFKNCSKVFDDEKASKK